MKRLIIGVSGANGAIYGARLLRVLRSIIDMETRLVTSAAARQMLALETDLSVRDVQALIDANHDTRDIATNISSGSFQTARMVTLPCSVETSSGIVYSYTDGLLIHAADVALKERRPLVLYIREAPLHLGYLRLMTQVAEIGTVIMPPVPMFYHCPQTLSDVINQTVNRVLGQSDITLPQDLFTHWQGAQAVPSACKESSVALFQDNFVTAIISSTFNSLEFNEMLRLDRQARYLQNQDIIATSYQHIQRRIPSLT